MPFLTPPARITRPFWRTAALIIAIGVALALMFACVQSENAARLGGGGG